MRQHHTARLLCLLLLAGWALAVVPVPAVQAQQGQGAQKQAGLTAQEAAAKARARYGGKVLKVTRKGDGYQVRLLQDSGRVVTVTIRE
jgi:starvation-inducible outer membrane lipoprotein